MGVSAFRSHGFAGNSVSQTALVNETAGHQTGFFEAHIVEHPDGSLKTIPKPPFYVLGEQLRMLAGTITRTTDVALRGIYDTISQISQFIQFPGARAEAVCTGQTCRVNGDFQVQEWVYSLAYDLMNEKGLVLTPEEIEQACFDALYDKLKQQDRTSRNDGWKIFNKYWEDIGGLRNQSSFNLLEHAIVEREDRVIFGFCKEGIMQSPNSDSYAGLLHFAIKYDLSENLFVPLAKQLNPNAKNSDGLSPLGLAVKLFRNRIAERLIHLTGVEVDALQSLQSLFPNKTVGYSTAFGVAAAVGNVKMMRALHINGLDADDNSGGVGNIFHLAVLSNQTESLRYLTRALQREALSPTIGSCRCVLKHIIDDCIGQTPLGLAASLGYDDCIKILAEGGCDIYRKGVNGRTAMHEAVIGSKSSSIFMLFELGDSFLLEIPDANGNTPEQLAAQLGDTPIHALLVQLRLGTYEKPSHQLEALNSLVKVLNISTNTNTTSSLIFDCFNKIYELCRNARWDVIEASRAYLTDLRNEQGYNILMQAIIDQDVTVISGLMQRGVLINSEDSEGDGLLHLAVKYDVNRSVLSMLTSHIDINTRSRAKLTPLGLAIKLFRYDLFLAILQEGADVNCPQAFNSIMPGQVGHIGAWEIAVLVGNIKVLEILTHHSALTIYLGNKVGNSFHLAVTFNLEDSLDFLMRRYNASLYINSCEEGEQSLTPLMLAALQGRDNFVKTFIELKGVDVYIRDSVKRRTAMHQAVLGGNCQCIRMLFEAGGKLLLKLPDKDQNTPLQLALKQPKSPQISKVIALLEYLQSG